LGNFGLNVRAVAIALACASATVIVHVQSESVSPAFSRTELVPPPIAGWPTNGGNLSNQRYSPLTEINRGNVARLKGVWRTQLRGSGLGPQYSNEAQPLVFDGVIYVVTGADDVFAVAVETGSILWEYQANLDPKNDAVCCGWTSRGVGLGDGKIFVGQLDGRLVALDQRTGRVVWSIQAERWQEGFTIPSAPLYYDGLIITGFAGAERGIRGRVKAFNAKDGSLVWTFYTIPGPGEPGHETWPMDNDLWQDGGASVWHTPAVDPELGLLYFGTGNPGPDYNGLVRKGDNLFSVSTVAVDVKTGKYRWHFQHVHHDIWDYDVATPPVLFDLTINGQLRKGIAQPSKTGWVYILDRATGKPLVGIDERAVPQEPRQGTAATQPYPRGDAFVPQSIDIAPEGATLVNKGRIFTPFWKTPVPVKPAIAGGANWAPAAYDPPSGHLMICASDRAVSYVVQDVETTRPPAGANYVGGAPIRHLPLLGVFAAMDLRTNRLVWQQQWGDQCFSGVAVTAGGLAFVGRNDGRLTALDTSDGKRLWEFQTGAGMNSPVSVFQHNGRQYVVAYSAGNMLQGTARGDSLWLFGLDGTLEPPVNVVPSGGTIALAQASAGPPNLDNGKATYDRACGSCHGPRGEGGHDGAPSLRAIRSSALIMQTVGEGRREMPSFSRLLTADEIRDVAEYVSQRLSQP
jgi:quinohemoprotein ethanol dehydrogenase